ncbi:hypothetical protein FOA52_004917 [Chlamydomonas sp. UWO 241]|nr:hypothetical protein FOA52_004917 [Chlamydomonas sp. UWO 241]
MIRGLASLLPGLRLVGSSLPALGCEGLIPAMSSRAFRAVADVEIDFSNRETLKKYVGVRDHLSRQPGTKSLFMNALLELKIAATSLPATADYRRAVEATVAYRLKVCGENESDGAVEEVLDAHLEELIQECKDEIRLIPLMQSNKPWDVPAEHAVPVYNFVDGQAMLAAAPPAANAGPPPPPPPYKDK